MEMSSLIFMSFMDGRWKMEDGSWIMGKKKTASGGL